MARVIPLTANGSTDKKKVVFRGDKALANAFKIKSWFDGFSLKQQFLGLTTLILVSGMLIIGYWIGRQIEISTIQRAVSIASIYVESILAAQQTDWSVQVNDATHEALDRIFLDGPLKRIVVRFKFWRADGTIMYSDDHNEIGQRFKIDPQLDGAFRGQTSGHVSELSQPEHENERQIEKRLLEVFVPVRSAGRSEVAAVAEFYYSMDDIERISAKRAGRVGGWLSWEPRQCGRCCTGWCIAQVTRLSINKETLLPN